MIKILTCNCKRNLLEQLNINCKYAFSFYDCLCNVEDIVFATRCKDCRSNLVGFARNFFASVICYYYQTDKNLVCRHCKQLFYDLNFNTMKISIREKDLQKEIELMEIDKYLEIGLKADPIFFYSKEHNRVNISNDAINWGNFFHNKETMQIVFFFFLVLTKKREKNK